MRDFQRAVDAHDQAVADRLGLHRTDLRALDVLDERGPVSVGELATAARITTGGGVTALVDRLVTRGLVERSTDPADGRRALVGLTPAARRSADRWYEPVRRRAAEAMSDFDAAQLQSVAEFLERAGVVHREAATDLWRS